MAGVTAKTRLPLAVRILAVCWMWGAAIIYFARPTLLAASSPLWIKLLVGLPVALFAAAVVLQVIANRLSLLKRLIRSHKSAP